MMHSNAETVYWPFNADFFTGNPTYESVILAQYVSSASGTRIAVSIPEGPLTQM